MYLAGVEEKRRKFDLVNDSPSPYLAKRENVPLYIAVGVSWELQIMFYVTDVGY